MRSAFVLVGFAMFGGLLGCVDGDTATHDPVAGADEYASLESETEQSFSEGGPILAAGFYTCGLTCPSGYHPSVQDDSGAACPGTGYDRTYCESNSGSFYTCGITCPAGWHPSVQDDAGITCAGSGYDRAYCQPNSGSFYTCGTCPAGWHATFQDDAGITCSGLGVDRSYCVPN